MARGQPEAVILVIMQYLFVAQGCMVWYDCHDPRMGHDGRSVISPLLSGVQSLTHHYGCLQLVPERAFDPARAYMSYGRSVEIQQLSLRPIACRLPHTFANDPIH